MIIDDFSSRNTATALEQYNTSIAVENVGQLTQVEISRHIHAPATSRSAAAALSNKRDL